MSTNSSCLDAKVQFWSHGAGTYFPQWEPQDANAAAEKESQGKAEEDRGDL